MDERARRIGLNEAVFREVNERIQDLAESFGLDDRKLDLVCECGDASCVEQLHLTMTDYESVRSDPRHFAIHHGHEIPGVEDVVERHEDYDVVRKHEGDAAALAEQTDPRH